MTGTGFRLKSTNFANQWKKPAVLISAGLFSFGLLTGEFIATADAQEKSAAPDAYNQANPQAGAISRDKMLNQSVDSWSERLRQEGGTLQEWMQLVRYYGVLGQDKKALAALATAKEALKDDPQAVRRLIRFAKMVGIKP